MTVCSGPNPNSTLPDKDEPKEWLLALYWDLRACGFQELYEWAFDIPLLFPGPSNLLGQGVAVFTRESGPNPNSS